MNLKAAFSQTNGADGGTDAKVPESVFARLSSFIPSSSDLSESEWRLRHRIMVSGYVVTVVVALGVTMIITIRRGDFDLLHTMAEALIAAAPGCFLFVANGRQVSQLLTSTGLLIGCGLLVHGTGGLIESHFAFFVTLPLIALYADWRPYLYAVVYVALTHGVVGTLAPETMYNHPAALAAPFTWGLIHAAFVIALSMVMVVHWNFSDRRRLELSRALDELTETQAQLVEAQKLESIGSLAAGVAHEINTPIQFIGDNLRFLSETTAEMNRFIQTWLDSSEALLDPKRSPEALETLRAVAEEVDLEFALEEVPSAVTQSREGIERVAQIVLAMKGFSHPRNEMEPSDLNSLITTTVTVSRSEWKYVAEVDVDSDPDIPAVSVPPGSFNQVMLNLIVNAAHAIEERGEDDGPGRITIATRRSEDGMVIVSVTDNGCGMTPEIQDRVFDQFFTTKEVGRGTGQGLAIAHNLVTGLGGRIEIDSELGVGTTFTLVLPVDQTESTESAVGSDRRELSPAG